MAAAIIERLKPDPMKLQKLLYFTNAWNLVWHGEPMFRDTVEAWREGPMVDAVYQTYKHLEHHRIRVPEEGDPSRLSERDQQVLTAVLEAYGGMTGPQLRKLSHQEPWANAWEKRGRPTRGRQPIDPRAVRDFHRRKADFGGRSAISAEGTIKADSVTEVFERSLGVKVTSITRH